MRGDAELLHALALALRSQGWETALLASDGPVQLHLWRPFTPGARETVTVSCERDGAWFRSSEGVLVARCADIPGAVARINQHQPVGAGS